LISYFPDKFIIRQKESNEEKNSYTLLYDINNNNDNNKLELNDFIIENKAKSDLVVGNIYFKLNPNYDIFLFSQKYKEFQSLTLTFKISENSGIKLIPSLFIILLDHRFFIISKKRY